MSQTVQLVDDKTAVVGTSTNPLNTNTGRAVVDFASASQPVSTLDTGIIQNTSGHYLDVILDVTVPNGGTATLTIYGVDPASGKLYVLLAGVAVSTAVTTVYRVGPALTAVANLVANYATPRQIKIQIVVATAAVTLSVGHQIN
jgi:hypothetical protein